jgi:hypothetical protein
MEEIVAIADDEWVINKEELDEWQNLMAYSIALYARILKPG